MRDQLTAAIPQMDGRNPFIYQEPGGDVVVATYERLADGTFAADTFIFTIKTDGTIEVSGNQPYAVLIVPDACAG